MINCAAWLCGEWLAEIGARCRAWNAVSWRQEAISLEERSTTSVVRFLYGQGGCEMARDRYAFIHDGFIEDFNTAGLKEAKTLLEGLN